MQKNLYNTTFLQKPTEEELEFIREPDEHSLILLADTRPRSEYIAELVQHANWKSAEKADLAFWNALFYLAHFDVRMPASLGERMRAHRGGWSPEIMVAGGSEVYNLLPDPVRLFYGGPTDPIGLTWTYKFDVAAQNARGDSVYVPDWSVLVADVPKADIAFVAVARNVGTVVLFAAPPTHLTLRVPFDVDRSVLRRRSLFGEADGAAFRGATETPQTASLFQ